MPLTATREFIAGTLAAQMVLVRLLEQKGVLNKGEYQQALQQRLENQPQGKYTNDHDLPLHYLIRKLSDQWPINPA